MALEIITKNSRETQKVAGALARHIIKECKSGKKAPRFCSEQATVLALRGDLGAGKTTFIQGFAGGLGVKEKILSPTFVILKIFKVAKKIRPTNRSFSYLYHLDCYRIGGPKEILDLGFKKIINNPENIVVIEWAERIKKILPKSAVWLDFEWLDRNKRKITLK